MKKLFLVLFVLLFTFSLFSCKKKSSSNDDSLEKVKNTNMALALSVKKVIDEGLRILGIQTVEKM